MRNAGLDEAQAGIQIAGRNINNFRYADDTTLMAESKEELKSLLMTVKEESENVGWKLNIQKTKIMASGPVTSYQIDGETLETVADFIFSSVQSLRRVQFFVTPWIAARQASLSITNSRSSLRFMAIESVMPASHLILCCPLLLLPPIPPSISLFNELTLCMRWLKYWSFSFSISPSKEHPGLIYFRMDWLDLLAVQGTLNSLLWHHSSKASILQHSAFFTVQLSYSYMTTGKTIALTRQTFVGKVISLLFNMLSRLVITFLPRRSVFRTVTAA